MDETVGDHFAGIIWIAAHLQGWGWITFYQEPGSRTHSLSRWPGRRVVIVKPRGIGGS